MGQESETGSAGWFWLRISYVIAIRQWLELETQGPGEVEDWLGTSHLFMLAGGFSMWFLSLVSLGFLRGPNFQKILQPYSPPDFWFPASTPPPWTKYIGSHRTWCTSCGLGSQISVEKGEEWTIPSTHFKNIHTVKHLFYMFIIPYG